MDFFEKINGHRCLFLADIREPEENELRVTVVEGMVAGPPEDLKIENKVFKGLREILPTDESAAYEVYFEDNICYSVLNESYATSDDYQKFTGTLFCIYEKSHFLDYVGRGSLATKLSPGPFKHYGLLCCNHVIDVASSSEPVIKQIRGA